MSWLSDFAMQANDLLAPAAGLLGTNNLERFFNIFWSYQVSANWGPHSTFAVEANTKTLCSKLSRFRLVKMKDWGELCHPELSTESNIKLNIKLHIGNRLNLESNIGPLIDQLFDPNNGRISNIFWIVRRGWVIHRSLGRITSLWEKFRPWFTILSILWGSQDIWHSW